MVSRKKLVIVILLLFFLIIIQVRNPEINGPFKGIVGNVLNPFVYFASQTKNFVTGVWSGYINLVDVNKDNIILKNKNGRLVLENNILKEKMVEYERLKKLLNFKDYSNFKTLACNIVGRNLEGYIKYIIIDRGSKDGIKKKDPVISYNGLVGKVSEVYYSTAKVIVSLNLNSNVSVLNSRTRSVGIARGDGRGRLIVDFYDRLDNVLVNDEFLTSGLGGVYPKGIVVGHVNSIKHEKTGLFKSISLEPEVDFYKLENVLVVVK